MFFKDRNCYVNSFYVFLRNGIQYFSFISMHYRFLLFQIDACALEVGATSKNVGGSMAQLLTAAAQVGFQSPPYCSCCCLLI